MTISCIIPVYNSSKTILRTLDSVKNQTYKGELQIIIVDDGSTDNTLSLIKYYREQNINLHIDIIEKVNGGVSSARNEGLRYAKGDFIAFLDSDDQWLSEKLSMQLEAINLDPTIDLLGCTAEGTILRKYLGKKAGELIRLSAFRYSIQSLMSTPSVLFKRKIYDTIGGFDENMKYSEDMNYWLRCMEFFNCYILNKPLIIVEVNVSMKNEGGLSNRLWAMEKGELANIKYIYKRGQINCFQFIFAYTFSFLKFVRRVIVKR